LKQHVLIVHCGEKAHKCTTCGKSFGRLHNLKAHMVVHIGENSHKSSTSGKSSGTHDHPKTCTVEHSDEMPYMCNVCEISFRRPGDLIIHMYSHSATLKVSMEEHDEEKREQCSPVLTTSTGSPLSRIAICWKAGNCPSVTESDEVLPVIGSVSQLSRDDSHSLCSDVDDLKTCERPSDIKPENITVVDVQQSVLNESLTSVTESFPDKTTDAVSCNSQGTKVDVDAFSVSSSQLPLDMETQSPIDLCSPFVNLLHDSLMEPSAYQHCSSSTEHKLLVNYFPQPVLVEPSHMDTITNQHVYCTLCKSLHACNEALALHMIVDHPSEFGMLSVQKQPQNDTADYCCLSSDPASGRYYSLQSVHMQSTAEPLLSSIQRPAPG